MTDVEQKNLLEIGNCFLSCLKEKETVVLLLDSLGNYIDTDNVCPYLLYHPAEELIGRNVYEIFPEHLAHLCLSTINKALKEATCVTTVYPLEISDKEVWFEAICIPFTMNCVIWLARDITQKKLEEKIVLDACSRINNLGD